MERARGGVPSVGVVKRRVLRGLWRRLVGVGIIGPGLSGSGLYTVLDRAFLTPLLAWLRSSYPTSSVALRFTPLRRCARASVVRSCPSPVGWAQLFLKAQLQLPSVRRTGFSHRVGALPQTGLLPFALPHSKHLRNWPPGRQRCAVWRMCSC